MALQQAAALLTQYNNTNGVTTDKKGIDNRAEQINKFASSSYANTYDFYAQRFNNTQNFRDDLWQTAFQLGEQDELVALLEANKDRTLSKEYYNDLYYDYQTAMLELKLPFLDNEKEEERFENQFNPETGEWEEVSIGNMTEQQYVTRVLQQQREARSYEITRKIEQLRKDNMGWWAQFGNTLLAGLAEFGEGLLSSLTGLLEFVATSPWQLVGLGQQLFTGGQQTDILDAYVDYMANDSLTAMEKDNVRAALDEWERTSTFMKDIDGNITGWGKYLGGIANSIGMMIPAIIANVATGGAAGVGMVAFYGGVFSSNIVESSRANPDSPSAVVYLNTATKAAAEALIEVALDKLLGGTVSNKLLGLSGKAAGIKSVAKSLSKAAGWRYLAKSALQEGTEEFLQDFSTNCVDAFTQLIDEGWEYEKVTFQTLIDSFLVGAAASIVMSTGKVAWNKTKSVVTHGKSDIYIEQKQGEVKRVGGLRRLAFDDMLKSVEESINQLTKEKVSPNKNLETAQEVYGILELLGGYYQGFDQQRIKNCERLLSKVRELENSYVQEYKQQNERPAMILTQETFTDIAKQATAPLVQARQREMLKVIGGIYKTDLHEMLSSAVSIKQLQEIEKAADEIKEKLVEANVKHVDAATNKNGETYTRDPDIIKVEEELAKNAKKRGKKPTNAEQNIDPESTKINNTRNELAKEYDWVFTTDGSVAVQIDNMVFVPLAWLRNYKKSEIYKFLQQDKVLTTILENESMRPFLQELVKDFKQISGIKNVTREKALMEFLFNESFYTHFLLKNNGGNVHAFMDIVFRMYTIVDRMLKTETSEEGKNYIRQIKEQIRETMRPATLKAILNWNIDPQAVGADAILNEADLQFVNQYNVRKQRASNALKPGKISNEYAEEAKTLLQIGNFNESERALIEEGLSEKATDEQRLIAVALLNEADVRFTTTDISKNILTTSMGNINIHMNWLLDANNRRATSTEIFAHLQALTKEVETIANYTGNRQMLEETQTILDYIKQNPNHDLAQIINNFKQFFVDVNNDMRQARSLVTKAAQAKNPGLFAMTLQACIDFGIEGKNSTQAKNDAINRFTREYGASPLEIMQGYIFTKASQYRKIEQEKLAMNVTSDADFVVRKLEQYLGTDYVVTPIYRRGTTNVNHLEEATSKAYDLLAQMLRGEQVSLVDFANNFTVINDTLNKDNLAELLKNPSAHAIELQAILAEADDVVTYIRESGESVVGDFAIVKKIAPQDLLVDTLLKGTIEEQDNMIRTILQNTDGIALTEILKLNTAYNPKLASILANWHVYSVDMSSTDLGLTDYKNKRIEIDTRQEGLLSTLVHELNHMLQYEYFISTGFSSENANQMTDLLAYVYNHYTPLIKYIAKRNGTTLDNIQGNLSSNKITSLSEDTRNILSYAAYRLVQGELWSEMNMHNGKLVKGFTRKEENGITYLVAPDGTRFRIPFRTVEAPAFSVDANAKLGPQAEEALLISTFLNVRQAIDEGPIDNENRKNTYHSRLTRSSATQVVWNLLRDGLDIITRSTVNIDEIVRNPQQYLREDLVARTANMTEGEVYSFLRTYIEQSNPGISLDRNAATHQYVIVNDNSFDDLLRKDILKKNNDTETDLQEKYKGKETRLDEIYSKEELDKLGVPGDIVVLVEPGLKNQFVVTSKYLDGAITIGYVQGRDNANFLDRVNHEFRHLMQEYNRFEGGFTVDFEMTDAMFKDIKKHAPSLFTEFRKVYPNSGLTDVDIAKRFVYYLVGGEQQAFGINPAIIQAKPAYVTIEGGKAKIFMPWYDAKTGEGMYDTEFISNKYEDEAEAWLNANDPERIKAAEEKTTKAKEKAKKPEKATFGKEKKGIEQLPAVTKTRKGKKITEGKYQYKNDRKFTKAKAEGTNLEYFYKKNGSNEMDPDLQNFVIKSTGHEKELPSELVYSIKRGKLTRQKFFEWFRNVDAKSVNDFTFDLINESFFNNKAIENMSQLEKLTTVDPAIFYASALVLRREGLSLASLVQENDINAFLKFINSLEGTKWKRKIENQAKKFNWYYVEDKNTGKLKRKEIEFANETAQWARVLMMQYYDGTLAGAFYAARAIRRVIRDYQNRDRNIVGSLDKEIKEGEDKTFAETFSTEEGYTGEYAEAARDIIGMYEEEVAEINRDAVIYALSTRQEKFYQQQAEQKAKSRTFKSDTERRALIRQSVDRAVDEYRNKLEGMTDQELALRYNYIRDAQNTDVSPTVEIDGREVPRKKYVQVRANIIRYANQLLKRVNEGQLVWSLLPEDVRNMFETVTTTDENGKKYQTRKLKEDTYLVGRGGQNIKDTTFAQRNEERLKAVARDARAGVYQNKDTAKRVKQLETERERRIAKDVEALNKSKGKIKTPENVKTTEFKVDKKKKKTSDTPNVFNIVSAVEMPDIVRKIFDTSFADMADTKVQFASVDEEGNLYTKDSKEFKSRLQHEVANWNTFYEANRETLMNMTRQEMLDMVEFIQSGVATLNGPVNKLYAFQLFLLGYVIDAGRRNTNGWNMSDAELAIVQQTYERLASAYGSGLQAVSQMLNVINPLKQIQQRMLDEYNITELEAKPLYNAIEALQKAKTYEERKQRAVVVAKEMKRVENLFVEKSLEPKGFGKRWYKKLTSARYTFMLSSPMTWVRNQVSNVVNLVLNRAADAIGNIGMPKDSYKRADQWNLAKVKTSDEVKAFIDREIKNNPAFKDLFEGVNKYDYRGKEKTREQTLFISLITQALERKYAAEHRFDSKIANMISNLVNRMISDKAFIKLAATRYLGKMLTIEVEKGKVSLDQGLSHDVLNLFAESILAANTDYMRKRSALADMIDGMYDKHRTLYEVLHWFQPFINSSFNWFQEMLKYTPAGLIRSIYNMTKIEQTAQKLAERRRKGENVIDSRMAEFYARRDLGKGVIGMLMLGLGAILAATGVLKIEDDDDKFYMTVYDTKVDISNIFASSSILVGASLMQIGKKSAIDIMDFIWNTYTEGFLLKDIIDRHRWDSSMYEAMLTETESILRSFVPQFVQLFVRALNNEKIKYSSGMKGMWERWLNSWIPTQPLGERYVNPYTGETQMKYALPFVGELLKGGLIGPRIFWEYQSDMQEYVESLGMKKGAITANITVDGAQKELDWYEVNKKYGELNKMALANLKNQSHNVKMKDGSYRTLPWSKLSDEQKASVINRTMTQNSTIAKIWYWTEQGHKYYAENSLYQRLRAAGVTSGVYLGDRGFVE